LGRLIIFLLWTSSVLGNDVDVSEYSEVLDQLYRGKSTKSVIAMTIKTPHYERTLEMKMWTLGLDHSLVQISSPRKEKGNGTLKRGNEMWNYLSKIDKLVRIPPSMMMSAWMGGDFTNDDIVRDSSWSDDYESTLQSVDEETVVLEYRPKPDSAVTWEKIVITFDAALKLPMTQVYYDEKGEKVRLLTYSEVEDFGGRKLPTVLTMRPLDKEDQFTTMQYKTLDFETDLKKTFFTTNQLRKRLR